MIILESKQVSSTIRWCSKNIAPRQFFLHNLVGGNGWRVFISRNSLWYLETDDPSLETYVKLKLL
jgi:hypothetical protein